MITREYLRGRIPLAIVLMLSPTIRYFILINVLISSYPVRIKFSSGDSQPKL